MKNAHFPKIRVFFCFFSAWFVCVSFNTGGGIRAAPLESGFALAPAARAAPAEKDEAFREARLRVVSAASEYERTPYRFGGTDRRGLDCSGFVYLSFHDALGVAIPRNTWSLYSWVEKIQLRDAHPGDLLFFATTGSDTVSHVGIFIGDGRFIHSASEGPSTGVIYSSLDEQYWSRTYLGAGRALPAADINSRVVNTAAPAMPPASIKTANETTLAKASKENGNWLFGFAAAPTWKDSYTDGNIVRGIAGQIRFGVEVKPFGQPMIFGLEFRPEWDGALGVFRVPLTLSWGYNDAFRFFAGPVLSFGDAALSVDGTSRHYAGGTSWLGAAGVTFAPFGLTIANSCLSPYVEAAWQSYFSDKGNEQNLSADLAAGFRFSTGLRFTWRE